MGENSSTAVADLVVKLHSNIDSIHQCIQSLSDTSSHDAELERLSTERETKIAELRTAHENVLKELAAQREKEAQKLAEQRRKEEEELEAQRQREYEELMARRRREDEERKAKMEREEEERARLKKEEDDKREQERLDTERSLQEKVEAELERLEDEMERKVEEGKRALRELDEKRKAINAQIDAALNTPTVIPTIYFRSRAKTLRSEQKDMPKTDTAASVPAATEPRDIHKELDEKPVAAPREPEEPAADEAKKIPIESMAEYDHLPEASNDPVSDTSAESNVTEDKKVTAEEPAEATEAKDAIQEDEPQPIEVPVAIEKPEASNLEKVQDDAGATELERSLAEEHGIAETNAVSTPSEVEPTSVHNAEAPVPEVQEPTTEILNHEAHDGDESDHLKEQHESSQPENHSSDDAPVQQPAFFEAEDSHHELEDLPSEIAAAPLGEPIASEGKNMSSNAEKPFEDAGPTNEETKVSSPEIPSAEPVSAVDESPITEALEVQEHAMEDGHVPEDQQVAHSSNPVDTFDKEGTPDVPKNKSLDEVANNQNQGQEQDKATLDEQVPEPEYQHIKATTNDHNIEEPVEHPIENKVDASTDEPSTEERSENPVEDATDEQTHSDEVPEDQPKIKPEEQHSGEVEEHENKNATTQIAEFVPAVEEKSMPEETSSTPTEHVHQDAPEDQPELEQSEVLEESGEHVNANAEHPELAHPAIAWWEKKGNVETPVREVLGEVGLFSKSPLRNENSAAIEQPFPETMTAKSVENNAHESGNHTMDDQDAHVTHENHPETEEEAISETLAPTTSEEHIDEISHLSDVEEENKDSKHAGTTEETTADFMHEDPGADDGLDGDSFEEFDLAPVETLDQETDHTTGCEENIPIHVEEREADSASETVEDLEIEPTSSVHEEGHEVSNIASAFDRPDQRSNSNGHTFQEPEKRREDESSLSELHVPHSDPHQSEDAVNLHTGTDEPSRELKDQERDIMDDYASSGLTQNAENQPGRTNEEGSWPLQHTPHAEAQADEQEMSNERPVTPTQASSIFEFAPSTPRHLIQEENNSGVAESPVTVLDADDLFEDDDEEEHNLDQHEHANVTSQESMVRSLDQVHDSRSDEAKEGTTNDVTKTRPFLPSLVDTIRPDLSLLRRLANQNSSPARTPLGDDLSVSEYSQATPGDYFTPGTIEPTALFPPQEPEVALHIRTHTADTVPSFRSYAQSDDASTPTTPSETASSPFVDEPSNEPNIRSSWQDNSALQGSDHTETQQELKPQASPMQGEFDPYNTQTYPNYISPKASQVNLRTERSPRNSFSYTGGVDPPRFSTQSSISTPPPVPAKSPRLFSINTSQRSPYSEGRPYDSPISATRSHHESESPEQYSPTQSRIPRRPTDRTIATIQAPVSSPSIPSNSFFQKTRSLFESASESPSQPAPTRPLSSLFTVNKGSPSPPRRNPSRPTSLLLSSSGQDELIPKSLDKDGKPPSPVFTIPAKSLKRASVGGNDVEQVLRQRNSNPFLDGLSKLVGSGGLEDSMHNPNRRMSNREKEPLLRNAGDMDGY